LRLDDLEHGFTHFKLTIEPYLLRVLGKLDRVTEPGVLWLSVEEAKKAALPAPVRSILNVLAIHRLRIEQLVNEGKPRKVTARAK
jgi:A/G-specific adenine glycosylase